MKIANNNILKLAFVFSITVCSYSHAGWFNKPIDKAIHGLEKVGTNVTNGLTEAGTVVAIKTTATAVAIKVGTAATAAAPVAKGISLGIGAVQIAKPYIIPTPDEGLSQLHKEQAAREFKAKNAFFECFTKNKLFPKNNSGYPDSCKQLACMFELISGQEEFNRTVKGFNK